MIFRRVVCGVNGSVEAIEAARQATRIADPSASTLLVNAVEYAADELWDAPHDQRLATANRLQQKSEDVLERARRALETQGTIEARSIEGSAAEVVLAQVADDPDCLLALGPPSRGRLAGVVAGEVVTQLLHKAPCSVLVARGSADPDTFPHSIVVGVDGSAESEAAFAVAWELRERFGAEIRPTVARGGKGVDLEAVQRVARDIPFQVDGDSPADALSSASAEADLVIVGSRGLHGARAIGSVSERVGHQAASSVLVVRGVSAQRD